MRKVNIDELVGAAEIAERLGIHRQTVHLIHRRPTPKDKPPFPEPIARLKQAMVWAWPDVEAWAKKTGRL